jgi:serine/threonine protein kinase
LPNKYSRSFLNQRSPGKVQYFRIRGADKVKEPQIGSLIARRYYLLSILGKGGMSVVFKARDRAKRRILAVKTLRYQWADDGLTVRRFQREAQTLSLLRHPAIVNIHDFGETPTGQPFFVMDYLTGMSLADLLAKQSYLPVKRVRSIFRQVFDAVHHAHNTGLVHRDLKPGNIMLVGRDEQGDIIKIVDFGIAKLQQEAQKLTRLGEVWGSPVYMSPEQCQGASLDKRSDIYSLGICVFESLTGQLPFYGKNYFETMSMQISQPPPALREVRADLLFNQELEDVLLKALNKDPEKRFQTIREFKDRLEAAVDKLLPSSKNKTALEVKVRMPGSAGKGGSQTKLSPAQETMRISGQKVSKVDAPVAPPRTTPPKPVKILPPEQIPQQRRFSEVSPQAIDSESVIRNNVVVILFVVLAACSALGYLYVFTQLGSEDQINKITPEVEKAVVPRPSQEEAPADGDQSKEDQPKQSQTSDRSD